MNEIGKQILSIANAIQNESPMAGFPSTERRESQSEQVLPFSVVSNTRGYIEQVVHQINGCYEDSWFDACAVMIRRLIETLIIEVYEQHSIANKIKNTHGDFIYLKDLIDNIVSEPTWNLGRNTKKALPRFKDIGDLSAHNRRYIAYRNDIDKIIPDLRTVVQELVYLSGLK